MKLVAFFTLFLIPFALADDMQDRTLERALRKEPTDVLCRQYLNLLERKQANPDFNLLQEIFPRISDVQILSRLSSLLALGSENHKKYLVRQSKRLKALFSDPENYQVINIPCAPAGITHNGAHTVCFDRSTRELLIINNETGRSATRHLKFPGKKEIRLSGISDDLRTALFYEPIEFDTDRHTELRNRDLYFVDLSSGKIVQKLRFKTKRFFLSPDGNFLLASVGIEKWNLFSKEGKPLWIEKDLDPLGDSNFLFSKNSKGLLVFSTIDATTYDIEGNQKHVVYHPRDHFFEIGFLKNDLTPLLLANRRNIEIDPTLRWMVDQYPEGKVQETIVPSQNRKRQNEIALSADEKNLLTLSNLGEVSLWPITKSGTTQPSVHFVLPGFSDEDHPMLRYIDVAFTPSGKIAVQFKSKLWITKFSFTQVAE